MKKVIKFVGDLLGKEGIVSKVIPSALKEHTNKVSSKRIFKLGGGGFLLFSGIGHIDKAIELSIAGQVYQPALYGGIAEILGGIALAVVLSTKIKDIATDKAIGAAQVK